MDGIGALRLFSWWKTTDRYDSRQLIRLRKGAGLHKTSSVSFRRSNVLWHCLFVVPQLSRVHYRNLSDASRLQLQLLNMVRVDITRTRETVLHDLENRRHGNSRGENWKTQTYTGTWSKMITQPDGNKNLYTFKPLSTGKVKRLTVKIIAPPTLAIIFFLLPRAPAYAPKPPCILLQLLPPSFRSCGCFRC